MPPPTPDQLRTRERVEGVIRLMAPALDLVLAAGDRLSRLVESDDHEYYPPRATTKPADEDKPEGLTPPDTQQQAQLEWEARVGRARPRPRPSARRSARSPRT